MSDKNGQTTTIPTGGQTTTPAPDLKARIKEIGLLVGVRGLKTQASLSRTGTKAKRTIEEKVRRAKDALSGKKSENDYVRRHTRLAESLESHAGDPLMKEAIEAAKSKLTKLPPVPVDGKTTEWAAPYVELGQVADALFKAAQECESKRQDAAKNPATAGVMKKIADAEARLAERKLPEHQYESYSKVLRLCSADVVSGTTPIGVTERQVDGAAAAIGLAIKAADALLGRVMDKHTKLSRLFAASTIADEERLAVAGLLSAGEAAGRAYDEKTANAKLDLAASKLGTAPDKLDEATSKLPSAADLLDKLTQKGGLRSRLAATQNELAKDSSKRGALLVGQGETLMSQVESVAFMLKKGGDAAAGDAMRLMAALEKELAQLEQARKFDPVETGKAKQEAFAKECKPIEEEADKYYESVGAAKGYQGEFHAKIERLKLTLAGNAKGANTEADLQYDQLVKELKAIEKEIEKAGGGDKPSPEKLAFQAEVTRFERLIHSLDEKAEGLMTSDSDQAITLGLVAVPGELRRDGEKLTAAEPLPPELEKTANALKAVNDRIQSKLDEIGKVKAAAPTAAELLQQCETLRAGYANRLTATLDLVKKDSEKSFVTRELKEDQLKGLKTFGEALQKRLAMLAAPATSGSTDRALLSDTKNALTAFASEVKKYEEMGPGPSHVGKRKHFSDVTELADEILKLLGHTRFTARKDVTEEWTTKLNAIKKDPAKRDPDTVHGELTKMKAEVEKALKAAELENKDAEAEIAAVQKLWDLVTVPTKDLEKRVQTYTKAFAQFSRECEQTIDALRTADKPDAAKLEYLKKRFDLLTTASNGDLDKQEAPAVKAEQAYEAALAHLKQVIEVDIRLLREKAKEMGGEAGKEMGKQLDGAEKAAELAITTLKKDYNADGAMTMYDSIVSRLRGIEDSPQGSKTNGRNQLNQVEATWRNAVAAVHSRLDAVPDAVKKAVAQDGEAAVKAAEALGGTLVSPAKALFDPDAFKALIARMGAGDEKALLDAREDALAEVRRLRRVMLAEPMLRALGTKCPFKEAQVSFRPIENALMDLETNLNISDTV